MYIQKYYKVIRVIKDGDGGATPLYIENVSDSDGVFKLSRNSSVTDRPNLIYRIDNGEWFEYDVATLPSITVPSGSKIYFRGDNVNGFNKSNSQYQKINFTQNFNIGGCITSLLALDNFNTITDIPNHAFHALFSGQKNLLSAENLITENIITVGEGAFYWFFNETSLTTAPNFENVTTVASYGFYNCFCNCTNLHTSPNFSNVNTIINPYPFESCFSGCTSLQVVYAPNVTPWSTSYFSNWLKNVAPTGVMYKPTGLTIPTGISGVPEGWTTVDY